VYDIPGHTSDSKTKEKTGDFICQSKDSVMVYTDGSVVGGEAGSGACSAILYPFTASRTVSHRTRAVGRMVSIDECEIDGISIGIETVIDYFKKTSPGVHDDTVYILYDSLTAKPLIRWIPVYHYMFLKDLKPPPKSWLLQALILNFLISRDTLA